MITHIQRSTTSVYTASPTEAARQRRRVSTAAALIASAALAGCASVPLTTGATLSRQDRLGKESGMLDKKRIYANKAALASVKTVKILPTTLTDNAMQHVTKPADRALVANALDRAICVALSEKYVVVEADQPADLTIRNVVTDIKPTDKLLAGASEAVSFGSGFVLPVSVPRLPLGLGGLSVEGEAVDSSGQQDVAVVWAEGANIITTSPRISQVGDAYILAASYADDFSKTVIKGSAPSMIDVSLPSANRIQSFFGGKPKYAACDTFGREPGVPGLVAGMVGAPPEWTDKASAPPPPAKQAPL